MGALSRIRIGRVSSVDADSGMAEVTYPDRDDSVTAELPVFSFTDEYKMPQVGSEVLVLHLSNGAEAGVVMGHYWNGGNPPPEPGEGVFRKEMGEEYGDCYMHYEDGKLVIYADEIEIRAKSALKVKSPEITQDGEVQATKSVAVAVSVTAGADMNAKGNIGAGGNVAAGANVTAAADVTAGANLVATADAIIAQKPFLAHTHATSDGETSPPI